MKNLIAKLSAWINQAGNAPFGKITVRDAVHGAYVAVGSGISMTIAQAVTLGKLPTLDGIKISAAAAIGGYLVYLSKQLFENENGTFGRVKK